MRCFFPFRLLYDTSASCPGLSISTDGRTLFFPFLSCQPHTPVSAGEIVIVRSCDVISRTSLKPRRGPKSASIARTSISITLSHLKFEHTVAMSTLHGATTCRIKPVGSPSRHRWLQARALALDTSGTAADAVVTSPSHQSQDQDQPQVVQA